MRNLSVCCAAFLFVTACGGSDPEPPKAPEAPAATAPPEPPKAPEPPPPAPEPPPVAPAPPPAPTLKETLGTIAKAEVYDGKKKKVREFAKQDDVTKLTAAIGLDQSPSGEKRRCPDDAVVVFKDDKGAEKGSVGFCKAETLGAEFWGPGANDRKGFSVADEGTVRKLLKLEEAKAKTPPAPAKPAATPAPKGTAPKK